MTKDKTPKSEDIIRALVEWVIEDLTTRLMRQANNSIPQGILNDIWRMPPNDYVN